MLSRPNGLFIIINQKMCIPIYTEMVAFFLFHPKKIARVLFAREKKTLWCDNNLATGYSINRSMLRKILFAMRIKKRPFNEICNHHT